MAGARVFLGGWANCERWLLASLGQFVRLSVCPSIRMETTEFRVNELLWNLMFDYFSKICLPI